MNLSCYPCGPLLVQIGSDEHGLAMYLHHALNLFTAPWNSTKTEVKLHITRPEHLSPGTNQLYLNTQRMQVYSSAQGLIVSCESGATARQNLALGQWTIGIPKTTDDIWTITDLDNITSLIFTTGWRDLGWTPVHAGLVCKPGGPAAMLCATSGGGKTTLTLALLRRGWFTLGDDKLLLQPIPDNGGIQARALVHTFNLFPHTRQWFPELGDITSLPRYSAWTDKRRVPIAQLRADAALTHANPSHVLKITRDVSHSEIKLSIMDRSVILELLMRQTVIPTHRQTARTIVATVATLASRVVGIKIEVGHNAYLQPDCLAELELALEKVT